MSCKLDDLKEQLRKDYKGSIPLELVEMRLASAYAAKFIAVKQKTLNGKIGSARQTEIEKPIKPSVKIVKSIETLQSKPTDMLKLLNDKIVFNDNKSSKKFDSVEELSKFAEEYNKLMIGKDSGNLVTGDITDVQIVKDMFTNLSKIGVPFKPLTVSLAINTGTKDTSQGKYETKNNTMYMYYNRTHASANPAQVVLHEYVHAITLKTINDESSIEIKQKVRALMDNVLLQRPDLKNVYGMKNEAEFIAEVIAESRLQEQLATLEPVNNKSVLEQVKEWFNELLVSLSNKEIKEVNALTEALELVIEIVETQADGKFTNSKQKPISTETIPGIATKGEAKLNVKIC